MTLEPTCSTAADVRACEERRRMLELLLELRALFRLRAEDNADANRSSLCPFSESCLSLAFIGSKWLQPRGIPANFVKMAVGACGRRFVMARDKYVRET